MINILRELYYGNINEICAKLDKEIVGIENDEEYRTYKKMYATFNEEQKQLFEKFLELYSTRYDKLVERRYM